MRRTNRTSSRYAYIFVSINLVLMLVFFASTSMTLRRVDESQDDVTSLVRDWYALQLLFETNPGSPMAANAIEEFTRRIEPMLSSDLLGLSSTLSEPLSEASSTSLGAWTELVAAFEREAERGEGAVFLPSFESSRFDVSLAALEQTIREFVSLQRRSLEIVLYFLGAVIVATIALFLGVEIESERERRAATLVQNLAQVTLTAQESERSRISQALHDSLAQELSVAILELGQITTQESAVVQEQLRQRLRRAVAWTRDLAHELHPAEIDQVGLAGALNAYCREVAALSDVNLDWDVSSSLTNVDKKIAINLYRIVQEALTNAIKHSRATLVVLRLETDGDKLVLTITDDGVGFRTDQHGSALRSTGLGLVGIRERANIMNAELRVITEVGSGSEISLTVSHGLEQQNGATA